MLEVPTAPSLTKKPPAILSMIGETPLVEITQFDTGPCQLFLKLENQNPTGSIKDRIALSMIEAAEEDGKLEPGGTVIEATAGNTGLGLGLVAAAKGYRVVLVIPDKMSQEKISHVKALGAEVVLTRSDVTRGHPEYYQDVAARLAEEIPVAFYVNQFGNPANPLAHERTTGGAAFYRPYETADGRYLVLAGQEPKFIHNLLRAFGRPEFADLCLRGPGPHQQPVMDFLAAEFRKKPLAEWQTYLATLDVCYGRVNTLPEAVAHSNLLARGMIRRDEINRRHVGPPIRFRHEPAQPLLREPGLGEHTASVLDKRFNSGET